MNISKRNQGGFTLLELLVVVAILAIIGGAVISSFSGNQENAAQGTATHSLAAIEEATRIYQVTQQRLPAELESMACAPFNAAYDVAAYTALTINDAAAAEPVTATEVYKFGGVSNVSGIGGGIGAKLAGKFNLRALTAAEASALADSGITTVRYAETSACDNPAVDTPSTIGTLTVVGNLQEMDIPNHAFESPRPDNRNRGRGFSAPVLEGAPVMVWGAGTDGYNNIKVGAEATDVLFGFGIGQVSDLVGNPESPFAKAPFYGQIGKDKYAHYIVLVNYNDGSPFVQAVVDARGDFLDEEIAEFTDQKT